LSDEERGYLVSLAEANIHATVINTVLPQLSEEDKKYSSRIYWQIIMKRPGSIYRRKFKLRKKKIKQSLKELKKRLLRDLEEAKKS